MSIGEAKVASESASSYALRMPDAWSPSQYERFRAERAQPFWEGTRLASLPPGSGRFGRAQPNCTKMNRGFLDCALRRRGPHAPRRFLSASARIAATSSDASTAPGTR